MKKLRKLAKQYEDLRALIERPDDTPETHTLLLEYLGDGKEEAVRMMACRAARAYPGNEALNLKLIELADHDPENEVRYEALRALGGIIREGDFWSVSDEEFQAEKRTKILALFEKTKDYLRHLLLEAVRSPFERYGAVEALGPLGGEDWVAPLIGGLWYSDEDKARHSALIAVAASCDKRWRGLVRDALKVKSEVLFSKALIAAGALRLLEHEEMLCRVASRQKSSRLLRASAIKGLASLNSKRSRSILTKIMKNPKDRLSLEARGRIDELVFSKKLLGSKNLSVSHKS
ncbi:MAG: HEAT repeat domain-containing protein [Planctomycetota bacterium]|nr:HEAT repeat domain-containing protein [Planctomycetota bacterium]